MKNKLFFISIILMLVYCLSAVCAVENITDETDCPDEIIASENQEILQANEVKTFKDLNDKIRSGGTVELDCNYIYSEHTDKGYNNGIAINKAVVIDGKGHTIDAKQKARIFNIADNNVVLKNINFNNGKAKEGGAIYCSGCVEIINCKFTNNKADINGGAIYWDNCKNGHITDCNFIKNTGRLGGALCWYDGVNCTIKNSKFTQNYANLLDGGAIAMVNFNNFIVTCSTFANNHAENSGGAIFSIRSANVVATYSTFTNNKGDLGCGGAIQNVDAVNCTFTSNLSRIGGAMDGGTAVNCTFTNNNARWGGAINFAGAVNCIFAGNTASDEGVAIRDIGNVYHRVSGCYFVNNTGPNIIYYKSQGSINNNIFINNNGIGIIVKSGANTDCNWFGNNASNYNTNLGGDVTSWLFLNATANPNPLLIFNTSDIIFKLNLYKSTSKTVSDYDSALLGNINLKLISTKGKINKDSAKLGDTLKYNATQFGVGTLTASFENVKCTIELMNKALIGISSVDNITVIYGEKDTLTINGKVKNIPGFIYAGNVSVNVEGLENSSNVYQDGSFSVVINNNAIGKLNTGKHNVSVAIEGDDNYCPVDYKLFNDILTVFPATIAVQSLNSIDIDYGAGNTFTVAGKINNAQYGDNYTGEVSVSVAGMDNSSNVNSDGSFAVVFVKDDVGKLSVGKYNVSIAFKGDCHYKSFDAKSFCNVLSVVRATISIHPVNKISIVYGAGNNLTIMGKIENTPFGDNYTDIVSLSLADMCNFSYVNPDGSFAVVIVKDDVGKLSVGKYFGSLVFRGDNNIQPMIAIYADLLTVVPAVISVESVDNISIVYGTNNTLNVTGKIKNNQYGDNYTGNVTVSVEGMTNSSGVESDGSFSAVFVKDDIGNLSAGKYNVSVAIDGDDSYKSVDAKSFCDVLSVVRANIAVQSVEEITIVYGANNTLTVTGKVNNPKFGVNYTGNVTVAVGGMSNSSGVGPEGSFSVVIFNDDVGKLSAGKYNVSFVIDGEDNYNHVDARSFCDVLSVLRATIAVQSVDSISIVYGTNNTITVTGNVNNTKYGDNYTGNVIVSFVGEDSSYNVGSDGRFSVVLVNDNLCRITTGRYAVNVAIEGDANFNPVKSEIFDNVLTIVPATIAIQSIEDMSVVYGVNNTVTVTGNINSTCQHDDYNGEITVVIDDTLTSSSCALNGQFSVVVNGIQSLDVGEHTVKVSGANTRNYNSLCEKTAILNVAKNQFEIDATVMGVHENDVKTDQNAILIVSNISAVEFNTRGIITVRIVELDKNYTINVPQNNMVKLDIITTPGTYTLTAQYTGNNAYNESNIVTKKFTVTVWNETNLQELIDSSAGNVAFEHNYTFTNMNATVNVTYSTVINGNGHTIDANGSSTALNIAVDNVELNSLDVTSVNRIAIASNATNTTLINVDLNNVNGTAIQLVADNSAVINITAANITGALIDVTGDGNTISNINSTGNAAIKVDGKGNVIENVTGARVIPKISATSAVKGNDVIITATVSAPEGNVTVQFQGKKYSVPLTDGKAVITIPNVGAGTYNNVAVNYEATGLYQSFSTKTSFASKAAITENKGGSIDYLSVYSVRITNAEGNYASGVTVKMTINGKTYNVKTDNDGYAKMIIDFIPKTYTITVQYLNVKKTNKIDVKSTIGLVKKTVKVKKTAKKLVLKAKLKWSVGGKVVEFKFKGKTYKVKTNSKGIAMVTIKKNVIKKLKAGNKYKFTVKYVNEYQYGKVKVKK